MDYIDLRDSGLRVSRLSLGTWALSGSKNWGENNESDSARTIHMALDNGINLIDTAARYNNGIGEEVVGRALKGCRDKAIVATKIYTNDLAYDDAIRACDSCLQRLGLDHIDILQIHWASKTIPFEETMRAFEKMKADGKIRATGICNAGPMSIAGIKGYAVTNQLPYNLFWRQVEDTIIPASVDAGMTIWPYCPLGQGLLTGKFKTLEDVPLPRREVRYYSSSWKQGLHHDTGFEKEIFGFLAKLSRVVETSGIPMTALALAFLKTRPYVGSVLIGARNEQQLALNMEMYSMDVPAEVMNEVMTLSDEVKPMMGTNPDMWQDASAGRVF